MTTSLLVILAVCRLRPVHQPPASGNAAEQAIDWLACVTLTTVARVGRSTRYAKHSDTTALGGEAGRNLIALR